MCFEPKRGLDGKHKINASVFEASLLICSKVPEDPCIFIGAPLMIQQVQKYPSSDTTLSLTHQIQISLIHQKRNTSTCCYQRQDVRGQKVRGQENR